MKTVTWTTLAVALLAAAAFVLTQSDTAEATGKRPRCSQRMAAGHWIFATEVGYSTPLDADITALGTMNIDAKGNVEGTFDATFQNPVVGFVEDATYTGRIVVSSDCTGTLEFATSEATTRKDTIALVSGNELWGMSQHPETIWTYRARKLPSRRR